MWLTATACIGILALGCIFIGTVFNEPLRKSIGISEINTCARSRNEFLLGWIYLLLTIATAWLMRSGLIRPDGEFVFHRLAILFGLFSLLMLVLGLLDLRHWSKLRADPDHIRR